VEKILSAIRDVGVDCLHAPLLTRALGSRLEHSRILSLDAGRKPHGFLEAEIYTNLSVLSVRFRLVFNRKIAIPTSASVLGKTIRI
jgi:hypothetical protein